MELFVLISLLVTGIAVTKAINTTDPDGGTDIPIMPQDENKFEKIKTTDADSDTDIPKVTDKNKESGAKIGKQTNSQTEKVKDDGNEEIPKKTDDSEKVVVKIKKATTIQPTKSKDDNIAGNQIVTTADINNFKENIENTIGRELKRSLGSGIELTDEEKVCNEVLMTAKNRFYDLPEKEVHTSFYPQMHFFDAVDKITKDDVYKILRLMPKGAALHQHDNSLGTLHHVVDVITYWEHLYYRNITDGVLKFPEFLFSETKPTDSSWKKLHDDRISIGCVLFDKWLYSKLSLIVVDPHKMYPDGHAVWRKFDEKFRAMDSLVQYMPAKLSYFNHSLHEMAEDGLQHIEARFILPPNAYELDGKTYSQLEQMGILKEEVAKFVKKHIKNFFGMKVIYGPLRFTTVKKMGEHVETAIAFSKKFKTFFAGFDMEGEEDSGKPLKEFVPHLLKLKKLKIPTFYHTGETNWKGKDVDENLITAMLLEPERIGHGYALLRHPLVMEELKKDKVPVTICPVSNQVLGLVKDQRNHPATILFSQDFPLTISSDDPGMWESKGVTHDWFIAFVAYSGKHGDLRTLKQLALNSIKYSRLDENERQNLKVMWERKWKTFISDCPNILKKN